MVLPERFLLPRMLQRADLTASGRLLSRGKIGVGRPFSRTEDSNMSPPVDASTAPVVKMQLLS